MNFLPLAEKNCYGQTCEEYNEISMNSSGNLVGIGNRPRELDDSEGADVDGVNVGKASDKFESNQASYNEEKTANNDNENTDEEKYGFRFYGN